MKPIIEIHIYGEKYSITFEKVEQAIKWLEDNKKSIQIHSKPKRKGVTK